MKILPRVLNKAIHGNPLNSVYIGRPSKWGNPFVIGKDGTREDVIERYKQYLFSRKDLLMIVKTELRGKDLVCWCSPEACHGDILLELANKHETT